MKLKAPLWYDNWYKKWFGKDYNARKRRAEIFCFFAENLFRFEKLFYSCKCINYPKERCVFAIWHAHQCGVHACNLKHKTVAMVSGSLDGEIISRAANAVGVETVRGSSSRDGAKASLELIKKIKEEDCNAVLTIDGPKGPNRVVKKGIIDIARLAGVSIVPAVYWSPQKLFLKFNSWDEFRFPLVGTKLVMLFGNPIKIKEDMSDDEVEIIRKEIEDKLNLMYDDLKKNYKKYLKGK